MKDLKPIRLSKYSGRNSFSDITNLGPTEFREITNFDLYSGMNGDYLRVRRGSRLIVPETDAEKLPSNILNKVVFPTIGGEWFIYNVDASGTGKFYAQREGENPILIGGSILEIEGAIAGFASSLSLEGVAAGQTVYIQIEKDLGFYHFTVWEGEWGASTLLASGSILDSTMLPASITLTEDSGSGVSGSVSLDVDPVDTKQGNAQYIAFNVGSNVNPVDMKVFNDRVYVFSPNGNKVIYYDAVEDMLFGRPMGLERAEIISAVEGLSAGDMAANSNYYYGIEKVTIKNGADLVASSPNRNFPSGELCTVFVGRDDSIVDLTLQSDYLNLDPYWTHLRLWRSKSATVNLSDPLAPIDAQGTPDQLYEVALITRAEMYGTIGPIDTSGDLPLGNDNVTAGFGGGNFVIQDGNDDSVLVKVIGLDLIGLIPIPGCRTGTVNKGRIWASGIGDDFIVPNGPLIDPVIREDWLYTTEQYSQYQEQWDAQAYLNAGRDGDRTESLLTLLEDVIGFRSSTTRRVASGNPASLIQMLDDKIGVPSFRCTGYVPGIGICAICSDGYFRYLGFDEQWHQYLGKTEISQAIYDLTAPVIANSKADFVYMNGKLLMLIPEGAIAALGVKEGKGWVLYDYPETFSVAFNFSNGERAAAAEGNRYLLEIETTETKDSDFNDLDADPIDITGSFEGFAFSGNGKLLEVLKYSFWGKLTSVPTITAKSSGKTWRVSSGFIDPGLFAANESLNEREYIFTPEPLDTTPFKWVPLRGQFITFSLSVVGPAMISWQQVTARIRETNGDLGVFPDGGFIPQGPGWGQFAYYTLNFEDPADTFYDASGKGQNYTFDGGDKTNRVTQKPGKGLELDGGSISRATDTAAPDVGVRNMVFKACFSLDSGGAFSASGRVGSSYYSLTVNEAGAVMYASNGTLSYQYQSTFAFQVGGVYVLSFYLKSDLTGTFWYDIVNATSFYGPRTTVRGAPSSGTPQPSGLSAAFFTNLTLGGSYAGQNLWGRLAQATQFWVLYATADDRNNEVNPVGFFSGPPVSGSTYAFTAQNGSGITGTVDVEDSAFPFDPQNLDIMDSPSPEVGAYISIDGIVSFFEAIKTAWGTDQAKRFWGEVRAY